MIDPHDLRIDIYRTGAPQPTPVTVRITHVPTGFVVTATDDESQIRAKDAAMRELRERLEKREGSAQ